MTPQQAFWQFDLLQLEANGYGTVRLLIDDYNVSLQIVRIKNKLALAWFIDKQILGTYLNADSPIGQKFGRPARQPFSKAHYNFLKKWEGYPIAEEYKQKCQNNITGFHPTWGTAKSFINHIKKTCTKIELTVL